MGFEEQTYLGFLASAYNSLLAAGSDDLDAYLAANFTPVTGANGSTYYIFNGIETDFLEMLEDEDIDASAYGFQFFSYIKSTWTVAGT